MCALRRRRRDQFEIKTPEQLGHMRRAGLVVAEALSAMHDAAVPGATTADLDAIAREVLARNGARSSFLGYSRPPFPAVICASVNDEVVHGIPGPRVLREGDLISLDFGAIVVDERGTDWHGDAAITVAVGEVAPEHAELSRATEETLWAAIAAVRVGGRLTDIGHAAETATLRLEPRPGAYGILEEYGGHGIGTSMHMDPHVLNYGAPGRGPELVVGMALAIEPMLVLGSPRVRLLDDQWTVASADGGFASHWEHTVAITADGPWVLTAHDGGAARLGRPELASR